MEPQLILGPMVRIGCMPMRILALKYGATKVYSPEMVDKRLLEATRLENKTLNTIDYIDNANSLCLRIHKQENLVLQLGTACPNLALACAKKVENDVKGIDINCGCPKRFSIQGGMGAALLTNLDLLEAILNNLVGNLKIPVTCKLRLLTDPVTKKYALEDTILMLQRIEKTGVSAIAMHARMRDDRPRDDAYPEVFKILQKAISIPLICNGDIFSPKEIDSLMNDGAAQWNVSIFGPLGHAMGLNSKNIFNQNFTPSNNIVDTVSISKEYLKISEEYEMPFSIMTHERGDGRKRVTFSRKVKVGGQRGVPVEEKIVEFKMKLREAIAQSKGYEELSLVFAGIHIDDDLDSSLEFEENQHYRDGARPDDKSFFTSTSFDVQQDHPWCNISIIFL